jgi:hypothetical protein
MCTAHVFVYSRANDDAAVVRLCAHRHHSDAEVGGDDPDWRARRHDHRGHQHVPELSSQSPTIHPLRIISFTCVTSYCNGLAPLHVSPLALVFIYPIVTFGRFAIISLFTDFRESILWRATRLVGCITPEAKSPMWGRKYCYVMLSSLHIHFSIGEKSSSIPLVPTSILVLRLDVIAQTQQKTKTQVCPSRHPNS